MVESHVCHLDLFEVEKGYRWEEESYCYKGKMSLSVLYCCPLVLPGSDALWFMFLVLCGGSSYASTSFANKLIKHWLF